MELLGKLVFVSSCSPVSPPDLRLDRMIKGHMEVYWFQTVNGSVTLFTLEPTIGMPGDYMSQSVVIIRDLAIWNKSTDGSILLLDTAVIKDFMGRQH